MGTQSSSVYIPNDIWAAGVLYSTHPLPKPAGYPGTHWLGKQEPLAQGIGSDGKEKRSLPHLHVPIYPPQGKKETGKFIADISGPFTIYKNKLNGMYGATSDSFSFSTHIDWRTKARRPR